MVIRLWSASRMRTRAGSALARYAGRRVAGITKLQMLYLLRYVADDVLLALCDHSFVFSNVSC